LTQQLASWAERLVAGTGWLPAIPRKPEEALDPLMGVALVEAADDAATDQDERAGLPV